MPPCERLPFVLFVDDDAEVLAGIRGLLRKQRHVWEMEFAQGGEAALAILDTRSAVDVVVSDMRMPGIDGASLLALTRRRHPEAVRIVLSGQADATTRFRGVAVAQQWLAKPCDQATLIAAIEGALVGRRLIALASTRMRVLGLRCLPSPPAGLERIRALVSDRDCDLEEVVAAIEEDPAIAAKLLQLSNSAFFSLPRQVTSIREAVVQIGLESVGALAASEAVLVSFGRDRSPHHAAIEAIRQRSLECARLASRLLATLGSVDAQETTAAFTAGLLHDVGRLAFLQAGQGEALDDSAPLAGAGLLAAWGLPVAVVDAAARHRDLDAIDGDPPPTSICVHLALRLLDELGAEDDEPSDRLERLAERVDIESADLLEIARACVDPNSDE